MESCHVSDDANRNNTGIPREIKQSWLGVAITIYKFTKMNCLLGLSVDLLEVACEPLVVFRFSSASKFVDWLSKIKLWDSFLIMIDFIDK